MTARRRRNLFPGVPAPGDRDPAVTHAYPGLADELRAEARREPAMLDLGDGRRLDVEVDDAGHADTVTLRQVEQDGPSPEVAGMRRGDTVTVDLDGGESTRHVVESATVDLGDGVQREGRVTLTPLHDGLRDESRDLPPADVDAWQAERGSQRGRVAPELAQAMRGHPEPAAGEDGLTEAAHPVWGGSEPFAPERTDEQAQALTGVVEPDEGHRGPEWRRVVDSTDEPVEVRLGCGCQIVIRSCTT